jgi:hypothetical protein
MKRTLSEWLELYVLDVLQEWFSRWFERLPAVSWGSKTFDAFDLCSDPHAQPLAEFLRVHEPLLYAEWYHRIFNATSYVVELEQELKRYQEERIKIFSERQLSVTQIRESLGTIKTERKQSYLDRKRRLHQAKSVIAYALSLWLAPVLFHAFTKLFAHSIQWSSSEALIVFPLLAGLAASASIGAKLGVKTAVKNSYLPAETELPLHLSRIYQVFQSPITWTVLVLVLEIGFGAPFIVRLLDRAVRENLFWQCAIVAGTSLGPTVNMAMAWSLGREGAALSRLEAKEKNRLAALPVETSSYRTFDTATMQLGQLRVQIRAVDARIRDLEKQLKVASHRGRIDYQKWIKKVERARRHYSHEAPVQRVEISQQSNGRYLGLGVSSDTHDNA